MVLSKDLFIDGGYGEDVKIIPDCILRFLCKS